MFSVYNTKLREFINEKEPQYKMRIEEIMKHIAIGFYTEDEIKSSRLTTSVKTQWGGGPILEELKEYIETEQPEYAKVTPCHINDGEIGNAESCPIALAIEDHVPEAFPSVGRTITFTDHIAGSSNPKTNEISEAESYKRIYSCSPSIWVFINEFDDNKEVKPGKLYFGTDYAWFIPEGDQTPYEALEREVKRKGSKALTEQASSTQ